MKRKFTAAWALGVLLLTGCANAAADNRAVSPRATGSPSPGCTLIVPRTYPPGALGGGPDPRRYVPFTEIDGPFTRGLSKWTVVRVSPGRPATFGVTFGNDLGMAVDLVQFVAKPTTYHGGDSGLNGAVWDYSQRNLRANGQTIEATFRGVDETGRPVPPGLYKMMVDLYGHRTSMNTCAREGAVPPYYASPTDTGIIYGLARISLAASGK